MSIDPKTLAEIGIVDTMFTAPRSKDWAQGFGSLVRDRGSKDLDHAAGYMFKDLPKVDGQADFVAFLVQQMDHWGIAQGLLPVYDGDQWGSRATAEHPDRLFGYHLVDPNSGVEGTRALRHAVANLGVKAAAVFPSGTQPQVTIADPLMYVIYAACVELDIPVFVNVGVPGPRFPMDTQHVEHLDQVCYDFPDLRVICRHGGEPWEALLVKLMLKWPNLYYSTSAFAPKHYPRSIVDYANSRGAEKVLYAGYFPSGLTLDRIMAELPGVGFKPDVWPRFLRENARRVLRLP